ncbi:MAG TPA: L,D-transpeptidase family protein [Sandaracinaceae bacterium]
MRSIDRDAARALVLAFAVALVAAVAASAAQDREPLPASTRIDRLVAYKTAHRLEAWSEGRLVRTYRIAIGAGGAGPKRYEGDRRTPEGVYRIDRRHRSRRFHRFLHVSYPNDEDRRRYAELRARGEVPEGAGIGGDIGIHGESDDPAVRALGNRVDWTDGCIAVTDAEIEELYRAVVPNAILEIHP